MTLRLLEGVGAGEVFLNSGPLFHIGTLRRTLAVAHAGGRNVMLRRVVPKHVEIVDSAESTAEAVAKQLAKSDGQSGSTSLKFFATDSVEKFRALGERFMGHKLENIQHVDIEP